MTKNIFVFIFLISCISAFSQRTLSSNPALDKQEKEVLMEEKFADAQREMFVGKIDKAIILYEELYAEDRSNASVSFELVKAYAQKKDFFSVEKYAKNVLEYAPNNRWMIEYIAGYMFDNNRPATAYTLYQKLITLAPQNKVYYENAVNSLLKQDKPSEAILVYNAMELQMGPLADIYMKRFELYDQINNEASALKEVDALIKKYPDNKSYLKAKARFLTKRNKVDEAVSIYKQILTIDAEDTDANLAVLSKGEDKEKPNAYLMSLLPIITNQSVSIDVKVKELLPYIENFAQGNNQDVKTALLDLGDKLVLTHPDEAKAYSTFGDILMISGDIESAVSKYEKTLKINNKIFVVWEQLMYGYLAIENYEALTKKSNEAIDLYPNQAINYFFASLCSTYKNNAPEAISFAEEGLMVSGGNKVNISKINAALASAYILKKDYEMAQKAVETSIELSQGKFAFAYEVLGDLFLAKGDTSRAKENYLKSSQLGNKSKKLAGKLQ